VSVDYVVVTRYEVQDAAKSRIVSLSSVAQQAGDLLDRLASRAWFAGKVLAGLGAAGGLLALKEGLFSVNSAFEQTEIGIASMFQILKASPSFESGLGMAKELLAGIRKDAAALPGEFMDFASMARTMTPSLLNAGGSIKEIRNLTRLTAVAAANAGLAFDHAGREMAMLLEGRAGAHNTLGMRLGISTHTQVNGKDFNAATAAERLEFIQEKLAEGDDALQAYMHSWSGLSSTIVDTAKQFAGQASARLFERLKDSAEWIIDWANEHQAQLDAMARTIGSYLVDGYDWLVERAKWLLAHWDQIRHAALTFGHQLQSAFERAWPLIKKIADYLGQQLKDPGKLLTQLALLRGGLEVGKHAPKLMEMMGSGGGAANALGGLGGGAGALTALLPILLGIGAVLVAVTDDFGGSAQRAKEMVNGFSTTLVEVWDQLAVKGGIVRDLLDVIGAVTLVNLEIAFKAAKLQIEALAFALELVNGIWQWLKDTALEVYNSNMTLRGAIDDVGAAARMAIHPLDTMRDAIMKLTGQKLMGHGAGSALDALDSAADILKKFAQDPVETFTFLANNKGEGRRHGFEKLDRTAALAGAGHMNQTNHFAFTLLSDADPERLAQKVTTHIGREFRNPRRALGLPTFRPA
jgi:hypothetical protein